MVETAETEAEAGRIAPSDVDGGPWRAPVELNPMEPVASGDWRWGQLRSSSRSEAAEA